MEPSDQALESFSKSKDGDDEEEEMQAEASAQGETAPGLLSSSPVSSYCPTSPTYGSAGTENEADDETDTDTPNYSPSQSPSYDPIGPNHYFPVLRKHRFSL